MVILGFSHISISIFSDVFSELFSDTRFSNSTHNPVFSRLKYNSGNPAAAQRWIISRIPPSIPSIYFKMGNWLRAAIFGVKVYPAMNGVHFAWWTFKLEIKGVILVNNLLFSHLDRSDPTSTKKYGL